MADSGAQVQPAAVTATCPRCRLPAPMFPVAALVFRCARCEWPFTFTAAAVSTPAVPASGVAAVNASGTVVAVTVTGGTLTAVTVSGTQAGAAAGTYLVPVGGSIAVTYSAAPAWSWALPATSAAVSEGGTSLTFAPAGPNVAFTRGQVLIADPAGAPDVVVVSGAPTAVSVPVNSLNSAHGSGAPVSVAQLAPADSSDAVPQTSY